jgi:hypothetical protein
MIRKSRLALALLAFFFTASNFSLGIPSHDDGDNAKEYKRGMRLARHKTSSKSISTTTITAYSAPGSCVTALPLGTPLLTNPAGDTSDIPAFLGYVAPRGSSAKLSALSIYNQTTNQTFLVVPKDAGKTFSIISPDGLVFVLDKNLNVTKPPKQACSLPSSPPTLGKREIEQWGPLKRQTSGPLVGGASVTPDVVNACGQPATGLSPAPGAGTLRLLFSCDLLPGQYLGIK